MELLKITEHLSLVPAQNNGRFPFAQSIYVQAERKILFDAGLGPKAMRAFVKEYPVDIVIVSHTHPDHIAGCHLFAGKAPIFVPFEGKDSFGDLDALAARFVEGENEITTWKRLVKRIMGFQPVEASRTFDGRTAFDLGSVKLVALHTPGHLMDHYCFYEEYSGVMMLFDVDLTPYGPWYGHRESDIDQYEASVSLIRSFNPEIAVSSHMGLLRKNVDSALEKFIKRIPERDEQIIGLLTDSAPQSEQALAKQFPFTRKFHPQLEAVTLYWETQMVRKHLDRLMERGEIKKDGDLFSAL
jgi:glyoxylase-like metal-dependent hydrolase (beta-lactamase superfamily II)